MITNTNRRDFLKGLVATAVGTQFFGLVTQKGQAAQLPSQMNLMLILTDQERKPMWLDPTWEALNLPNIVRLKNNGLSFENAFCVSAMCTPSRISMFTGLFPPQTQSPWTLTEDMQQTAIEPMLDPSLPNMATCFMEAGYDVIYKGKWHLSHGMDGVDGTYIEDDVSRYGFQGWDAPDAGGDTQLKNFGGGTANNDQRFLDDAKAFLQGRIQSPTGRPFVLIASFVNPHDVLGYPGVLPTDPPGTVPVYIQGGYDDSVLAATVPAIPIPPTVTENLATNYKPTAHATLKAVMAVGMGAVATEETQQKYLNFYYNLMKKIDGQIGELLAVFDYAGSAGTTALNNTLIIRSSDHGEMAICHGGLRQKTFVTYEEAIRVPLIFSNPVLYPEPKTTTAMVSHVDLLPTLCALFGVPNWQSKGFAGIDYSSIVLNPAAPPVQDYVLFSFDDIYAGSNAATFPTGAVPPPNRIRMIRTTEYKYARYFDGSGAVPPAADQQEFYDLRPTGADFNNAYGLPTELKNHSLWAEAQGAPPLTAPDDNELIAARTTLMNQLATMEATRLAPRAYAPSIAPENMKFEIIRWTDPTLGAQAKAQLTFLSRLNTNYQMQKSTDLISWTNTGDVALGNNGMIVMGDTLTDEKAYYRVQWSAAS